MSEREANGPFADFYDFAERMGHRVNRKAYDSLVDSGAFDCFGYHRRQYFLPCPSGNLFLDELVKYADLYSRHEEETLNSLFGDAEEMKPTRPSIPEIREDEKEAYNLEMLHKEKDLNGMYLSSHPLDKYAFELENFTSVKLSDLPALISQCSETHSTMPVNIGGFVTGTTQGTNKGGKVFYRVNIEDFSGSYELRITGLDVDKFMPHLQPNSAVFITGKVDVMFFRKPEEIKEKGEPPYTFKISEIIMLCNASKNILKGFSISINTPQLTADFREKLVKTIKKHKGNFPLSMSVYDPSTQYKIDFLSNKFHVDITNSLINDIKALNIQYEVLKK